MPLGLARRYFLLIKWKRSEDYKSQARVARNKYDKAANQTGGGSNKTKKPTELQYKVLQVIGKTATHGVDGADDLDTSRQQVQSALAIVQPVNDIVQR